MERGRWHSFDWIVGGSDFLQKVNTIVVKVTKFLQFRLVIPRHNVDPKSYRDRVDRLLNSPLSNPSFDPYKPDP